MLKGFIAGIVWGGLTFGVGLALLSAALPLPEERAAVTPPPRAGVPGPQGGEPVETGRAVSESAPVAAGDPAGVEVGGIDLPVGSEFTRTRPHLDPVAPAPEVPPGTGTAPEAALADAANGDAGGNAAGFHIDTPGRPGQAPEAPDVPSAPEAAAAPAAPAPETRPGGGGAPAVPPVAPTAPSAGSGPDAGPVGVDRAEEPGDAAPAPTASADIAEDRPEPARLRPSEPASDPAGRVGTDRHPSAAVAVPDSLAPRPAEGLAPLQEVQAQEAQAAPDPAPRPAVAAAVPPAPNGGAESPARVTAGVDGAADRAADATADGAAALLPRAPGGGGATVVADPAPGPVQERVQGLVQEPVRPARPGPARIGAAPVAPALAPVPGAPAQSLPALPDPATLAKPEPSAPGDLAQVRPQPGFSGAVAGVRSNRLPRIGDPGPESDAAEPVAADPDSGPDADPASGPASGPDIAPDTAADSPPARFERAFDDSDTRPRLAILLIDDGREGPDRAALAAAPLPVTLVLDAAAPDAGRIAQDWVAAGQEVAILAAPPMGATAADLEVMLEALDRALPQAVAVVAAPGADGRALPGVALMVPGLGPRGLGLVTWDGGLNPADQAARRAELPAARIFRALDAGGEDAATIRRTLDRAAFRAAQEGHVVVAGQLHEETVAAILEWALEGRAATVAPAPLSAVLGMP
ncbi:MAG: divergent polysaccharide deacetylase family protein [Gemmobacter sp.]